MILIALPIMTGAMLAFMFIATAYKMPRDL